MLTIENDRLRVRVKELGAELCGIYSKGARHGIYVAARL